MRGWELAGTLPAREVRREFVSRAPLWLEPTEPAGYHPLLLQPIPASTTHSTAGTRAGQSPTRW